VGLHASFDTATDGRSATSVPASEIWNRMRLGKQKRYRTRKSKAWTGFKVRLPKNEVVVIASIAFLASPSIVIAMGDIQMKPLLAVIIFCLLSIPCHAATQLLASLHQGGTYAGNGYEYLPVVFMLTDSTGGNAVGFSGSYSEADNGLVITASTSARNAMASLLYDPTAYYSSATGNLFSWQDTISHIWGGGLWTMYVPQRGPGLTGYPITNITETIDYVVRFTGPRNTNTEGEHTVRIYGESVPEPSIFAMAISIAIFNAMKRRRR
jgi:hypothetical protein